MTKILVVNMVLYASFLKGFYLNVLSAPCSQDSQRSLLQTEGVSVKEVASKVVSNPLSFCKGEKSGAESIKGIHHDQKQLTPLSITTL